jgi:uncharacterized membrane protein YqaE (UPF0057 family)
VQARSRNPPQAVAFSSGTGRPTPAGRDRRRLPVDILRIIIAIILPPLGVFLQVGIGGHFWLNILLTLLGYIPGIVHALYVILSR